MATTTRTVTGSLPEVVAFIEHSVMAQSSSASMEAAVDLETREGGVCVRGYERYSWTGSNRVGMTVTSVQDGPYVHIAGVSLGGSQAMFFKVNTSMILKRDFQLTSELSFRKTVIPRHFL